MSLLDSITSIADRINLHRETIETEEGTKTAIVMPFIAQILGYDVFNPAEVIPEFTSDIGTKRGEKVDYAIVKDGEVQMLIEVKQLNFDLNLNHASQLIRYFHTSNARIGVLTNGQQWHFYTDLERPNRMDERPFLKLDLCNLDSYALPELKRLTKEAFDIDSVITSAEELKYTQGLKESLREQFSNPSPDFAKVLANRFYDGNFTQRTKEQFTALTKKACDQFIEDRVNTRLATALKTTSATVTVSVEPTEEPNIGEKNPQQNNQGETEKNGIETTIEELEGFHVVQAMLFGIVDLNRVVSRDTKTYFGILLDDNNRKPICRLHFNRRQKMIEIFDEQKDSQKHPISSIPQIAEFKEQLISIVNKYDGN
ncbi:type I restriction endonuclease [Stomatohabitans albus]|uniref:type I restriction endonuclease n=1 Tax=Stomatohabitans albus TaxID=3110766 RepID=UPI00300CB513